MEEPDKLHIPETPNAGKKVPDSGTFLTILGFALGIIPPCLQQMEVEMNWIIASLCYFVCIIVLVWSLFVHATPHKKTIFRYLISSVVLLGFAAVGIYGTRKQYLKEHPILVKTVSPHVDLSCKMMPLNPPYAADTVVAGIHFIPGKADIRFYLKVDQSPIKNVDVIFTLINTSGEMLGIQDVAQLTTFPGISIFPVIDTQSTLPNSFRLKNGTGDFTVPMGSSSSVGGLKEVSGTWRVHCPELLDGTMSEFVLMVDLPYKKKDRKMVEGFITSVGFDFNEGLEVKRVERTAIAKLDDSGNSYRPDLQESRFILKKYGYTLTNQQGVLVIIPIN